MLFHSLQTAFPYCIATAAAMLLAIQCAAAEDQPSMKTYTFKQVGELEIKADVYRAGDETIRPVVVWIHGGALINGHRAGVSGRVKDWGFKDFTMV